MKWPPTSPPTRLTSYRGLGTPAKAVALRLSSELKWRFWLYHHASPWSALPPVLVVVMNCPAVECPYSAENWLVSSVNSFTASLITGADSPVTLELLLSRPSTVKLLLRGRLPPMAPPVPATPPGCEVVPGARSARLMTLPETPPPCPRTGLCSKSPLNVLPRFAVWVSTNWAPASTMTVSDTAPTSTARLTSANRLAITAIPGLTSFLNPGTSTSTV